MPCHLKYLQASLERNKQREIVARYPCVIVVAKGQSKLEARDKVLFADFTIVTQDAKFNPYGVQLLAA